MTVGDWFSFTNYVKVLGIKGDKVTVINQREVSWEMTKDILQEYDSSSLFEKEEFITRTEMIQKLKEAKDSIFQVSFLKKINENEVMEKITQNLDIFDDEKKLKKFSKHILEGEECVITAKLKNKEKLGRTVVEDLTASSSYNIRQVDHRTIYELILRGVKYSLKKGKKKNEEVNEDLKRKWNPDDLQEGQWFSATTYF